MLDRTLELPTHILEAALLIDRWAKQQGYENYEIGPIMNRFPTQPQTEQLIKDINTHLERLSK